MVIIYTAQHNYRCNNWQDICMIISVTPEQKEQILDWYNDRNSTMVLRMAGYRIVKYP